MGRPELGVFPDNRDEKLCGVIYFNNTPQTKKRNTRRDGVEHAVAEWNTSSRSGICSDSLQLHRTPSATVSTPSRGH